MRAPHGTCCGIVSEVLLAWCIDPDSSMPPCISIVDPVAQLMQCGHWKELLFQARSRGWDLLDRLLPLDFLRQVQHVDWFALDVSKADLTPETLMEHIAFLKGWAPVIELAEPGACGTLQRHVENLSRIAFGLSGSSGIMCGIQGAQF